MKIAVLGPKGTFSDKAYLEYIKNQEQGEIEPVYCATIDDVFKAAGEEDSEIVCNIGIAPIENTLDGYVQRTLDLLLEKDVYIYDENIIPVHFSLVGNVTDINEIRKLYVQFKTNGQCRQFINKRNDVDIIITQSNMESYYNITDEKGAAAIVPSHIAEVEKDRFVIEDVTDADRNYTRFVVFQKGIIDTEGLNIKEQLKHILKNQCEKKNAGGALLEQLKIRMPIYIMPAIDRPGILFDILRRFYDNRINLISIMSRPTRQEMGTYNFYIEIDALYEQLDMVLDTLRQIQVYNDIKMLGIYVPPQSSE